MTKASLLRAGEGLPRDVQGAADPRFGNVVRIFAGLFPGRRFGGGALAISRGKPASTSGQGGPTGTANGLDCGHRGDGVLRDQGHRGHRHSPFGRSRAAVLRRAGRDVLAEFGAAGKDEITVRDVLRHQAGLWHLKGITKDELLDHLLMEERLAAAPVDHLRGWPAYRALTYGWILSGLARAVTGAGIRELIRDEVASPLNTDGLHLGRPPKGSPTKVAQILAPQSTRANPVFDFVAPKVAGMPLSGAFGSMFFPGIKSFVQGDIPLLDGEIAAANGVVTARGLAKMYAAIANGGTSTGPSFCPKSWRRG